MFSVPVRRSEFFFCFFSLLSLRRARGVCGRVVDLTHRWGGVEDIYGSYRHRGDTRGVEETVCARAHTSAARAAAPRAGPAAARGAAASPASAPAIHTLASMLARLHSESLHLA